MFFRHCSVECDSADPGSCPAGYRCYIGPNLDYCLLNYPVCCSDVDCAPDQVCTVHTSDDGLSKLSECRPPLDPGGDPGDACDFANRCANYICTGIDICSEVCCQFTDCTDQYMGLATTCVLWGHWMLPGDCARDEQCPTGYTCQSGSCRGPACIDDGDCLVGYGCDPTDSVCLPRWFRDFVGQCMIECSGDSDCPADLYCQAAVLVDSSRVQGICYNPYSGNATGDVCDPSQGCDHGICYHGATDYCTQLCGDPTDCPAGMDCTPGTLNMGDLGSFPNTFTCTFP
jgi:hypothetical protein